MGKKGDFFPIAIFRSAMTSHASTPTTPTSFGAVVASTIGTGAAGIAVSTGDASVYSPVSAFSIFRTRPLRILSFCGLDCREAEGVEAWPRWRSIRRIWERWEEKVYYRKKLMKFLAGQKMTVSLQDFDGKGRDRRPIGNLRIPIG